MLGGPLIVPLPRKGSIPEALRSNDVAAAMKTILRLLQTVQGTVPRTDAARRVMRQQLASMTKYLGSPCVFLTLNPADVLHPYTWKFALSTDLHVLDPARLDSSLRLALQDVNLWRIVAQDPAAAVQAFHLHVRLFLEILLDVNASATHLEPDGIASSTVRGILTPLSGAFGSIEPQQRGSLHIHFLLFCYGFHSPQTLLRRFATQLPLLESRLWAWVQSIVATAFEAVPRMFALDADALRSLRPFPYSDQNLRVMHPSYRQHILDAGQHWFAGAPAALLPAVEPFINPFTDNLDTGTSWTPWSLEYLRHLDQRPLSVPESTMLLFDLRGSVLHSGLLHSCKEKTCYKGKLGRRGYCRLGFWHWLDISSPDHPHTWERCHGIALCPEPTLGVQPPSLHAFETIRHHQFFGRMNPAILATTKCNHDVSLLLRFPPCAIDAPDPVADIQARMATNMGNLLFYVTCYTTKVQPQLTSLWSLLQAAAQKSTEALQPPAPVLPHQVQARTTLSRLLLACQKRCHKSMQEMVSYLLGYDEFYCMHQFHKLFYGALAAQLQQLHPILVESAAVAELEAQDSVLVQPDIAPEQPETAPASSWRLVSLSHVDYQFRGADLADWPLYFYAAGVTRVMASKSSLQTPGCIPFTADHICCQGARQQVLTQSPWRIPHLIGPRIPGVEEHPDKRGLLLLLLFKPWFSLRDLLPLTCNAVTWADAWESWYNHLQQLHGDGAARADVLSPAFWAQRTIHVVGNIDNESTADPASASREQALNPDALYGVPDTTTVEHSHATGHDHAESESDLEFDPDHLHADPDLHLDEAKSPFPPIFLRAALLFFFLGGKLHRPDDPPG